uniref:Uncharacterized protein n=1 Tax=Anguilla anguilla TaxID=7936 RepID=A0A0E9WSG2_ANGAN
MKQLRLFLNFYRNTDPLNAVLTLLTWDVVKSEMTDLCVRVRVRVRVCLRWCVSTADRSPAGLWESVSVRTGAVCNVTRALLPLFTPVSGV